MFCLGYPIFIFIVYAFVDHIILSFELSLTK